jgi:hypothetical protein
MDEKSRWESRENEITDGAVVAACSADRWGQGRSAPNVNSEP